MSFEKDLTGVFSGGYVRICHFCLKVSDSLDELRHHVEESHDELIDEPTLDGPQFKIRKLKFYQDQLSSLNVDIGRISVIDVIEAPFSELTAVLGHFNQKQQELCLKIRQKERPLCSFSIDDDALPVDDPLEVEYQMLKAKHAAKLREYEKNLKLERLKREELESERGRLEELKNKYLLQ